MKRALIWIGCAVIIFLLIFDQASTHVKGVRSEKEWYLSQLDFEFSGVVDTVEKRGQALFHITQGRIDLTRESDLKKELKFNGLLDLFLYRNDGTIDMMISEDTNLKAGDSIYINTNRRVARVFRKGEQIYEHSLLKALRGRPF